ncbi:multidrug transporter MatE [Paenibacillus swuensis]|uniref:Multidrug transporter MatE n=1 Tax=Paenibacillus swuensis TaxID=1178515 RepID=A0A172TFJ3_9BACL|nr:MATE family efflux transporter [Paenibacillus swuensis]ANE45706.1 multidrug transporter MatE [Paenibacillus swuensis]
MKSLDRKFTLWALAWPIFMELFLQTLLGTVDTLSVSQISDGAVAVVGLSNHLFSAMMTLFMVVASGAGILIAQRIGSQREEDARSLAMLSLKVCGVIGLVLSVFLYTQPGLIAQWLNVPEALIPLAESYIAIAGAGMVFTALSAVLGTALRSTGNTKAPMVVGVVINIVHVALNYAFIFGAFGFPEWGLAGVAVSTLVSKLLGTAILYFIFIEAFHRRIGWKELARYWDRSLLKEVLHIGWPLGINMSAWVLTQLVIYVFLATLGVKELAAKTYMNTLESFCFTLGYAVALALQIQVAHLFGAGRTRDAYKATYKALWIGLAVVTVNALLLFSLGRQLLGIFTDDAQVIAIGISLLGLNLILQPGKMLNMALTNALNAVGDTRYTMVISFVCMWLVATGGSYVLGLHWGWGIVGVYICMIADEYIRGILCLYRWRGQKYLRQAEAEPALGVGLSAREQELVQA